MQRFLEQCAEYVYNTWSGSLPDICVVVPNRRAGVFFTSYLKKQLKKPVIGPRTTTINELMHSFSSLLPADQLKLLSHLYVAYREVTGSKESFDDFYFWGEILLADFDDIDKYLVDADDLFTNLSQVKEIESHFDYLTNEQKEYLGRFWGSLKNWEQFSHETDFVSFWGKLSEIYYRFRERLVAEGIGYSGLIMRDGMENGLDGEMAGDFQKYIFIGLNALNKCEQRLFKQLKEQGKAIFLWDYDDFYMSGDLNPAGKFLRENLLRFPPPDNFHFESDNFVKEKDIELVAVASSAGQSQVIPGFMKNAGVEPESGYDNTAIVLADESLLFPVLGAIPEEIGTVNVTMGYPVKNSPVVSLLISLSSMVRNSLAGNRQPGQIYHRWVTGILSHQLVKSFETPETVAKLKEIRTNNRIYLPQEELWFTDFHKLLFSIPGNVAEYTPWFLEILGKIHEKTTDQPEFVIVRELIYSVYQELEKINAIVSETLKSGNLEISAPVYFRLVMQHLNRVSVPFAGEPLSGLQVMGILETRCLDFDNILIIGLNEDTWPRTSVAPSIIPFSLRKAFGLPGIDDQDAMYTYYFYRLIGRAKKVTATWSTIREATSGGELSRYGFQLLLNSPHEVKRLHHDFAFQSNPVRPISIVSGTANSHKLLEANTMRKPLSPSAFNMFLTCRLKFWFRYAAGLKEPDEVSEEIDRQAFGNIFHKSVEILYKPWVGKMVTAGDMEGMSKRPGLIREAILRAFATEYFHKPESEWDKLTIEGKALLIRSTLENYVKNLLEFDGKRAPFLLHSLEESYSTHVNVEIDGITRQISVGGKIDRIDESEGVVSVIDYKTGSVAARDLVFTSVDELFDQEKKQLKKEVLQALIYSIVLEGSSFPRKEIRADIFSILNLKDETFDGSIKLKTGNGEDVKAEFLDQVKKILAEIYSASTIFDQTAFTERCKICPYNSICRK